MKKKYVLLFALAIILGSLVSGCVVDREYHHPYHYHHEHGEHHHDGHVRHGGWN